MPETLGNPLFHWTALELKQFFGIAERLLPYNAGQVWDTCNDALRGPEYAARQLISRANIECLCASDRLLDDLQLHARLAQSGFTTRVLPSLRGDNLLAVESPGDNKSWLQQLAAVTGVVRRPAPGIGRPPVPVSQPAVAFQNG